MFNSEKNALQETLADIKLNGGNVYEAKNIWTSGGFQLKPSQMSITRLTFYLNKDDTFLFYR